MTNFISCICCHNNKEALLTSEKICYDYAMPCTNKLEFYRPKEFHNPITFPINA